jgi:ketosteroid isomerase-like protein
MRTLVLALTAALAAGHAKAAPPTIAIPNGPAVRVHGPIAAARDLLAAELAFEAKSVAAGAAVAMRDTMDETDGLSFEGGEPVRGAQAIFAARGGGKPGGLLTWVPSEIFVDKAGEMGTSWGHFRFTPPVQGAPVVTGKYVTVWRRNDAGQWKGIVDIGTPD